MKFGKKVKFIKNRKTTVRHQITVYNKLRITSENWIAKFLEEYLKVFKNNKSFIANATIMLYFNILKLYKNNFKRYKNHKHRFHSLSQRSAKRRKKQIAKLQKENCKK